MKSRDGKSQRREEKRREEERISKRESFRIKKIQVREKGRKGSRSICGGFFPMICGSGGSGGSKSRLAKAAGTETSGEMRDEKLHAAVARSTFASQKAKNTSRLDHFWKLRCQKSAHHCGAKHIFEVNMCKTPHVRTTFGSWDVEKVYAVVARSTFRSQNAQENTMYGPLLGAQISFRVAGTRDCAPCQKWEKREGFAAFPKTMAGVGTFEEDLQNSIFRGRRSTRDMFIRDVRRSGRWFLRGVAFWSIKSSGLFQIILRDRCSTSYDLASIFRGRRSTLDRWSGKKRKTHWYEAVSSALNFPFLKEGLAELFSFLMLSSPKIEEVSQTCFRFLMLHVKFKTWGSLAELFFVLDVVKFKNWGSLAE